MRVSELEKQLAAKGVSETPTAAAMPASAAVGSASKARTEAGLQPGEDTATQLSGDAARESIVERGVMLHGFADVQAIRPSPSGGASRRGFALGSVDLYLTPELGDHVRGLMELNMGPGEAGVDVERLQLGYAFSDALTLWLGRFHTPFGYWNLAYHHGAQLQTSILRPRMLDFEDDGGFLPVHTTGLWATGGQRIGGDRITYHAYLGNGARISSGHLEPNANGDDNGNRAFGVAASYRMNGMTIGLNAHTEEVDVHDALGATTSRNRVRILGGHVSVERDNWELLGEGYLFRNSDLSGSSGSHRSWSAYAQIGRLVGERWEPYLRLEKASLDPTDSYFASLVSGQFSRRVVLGLRYNTDPRAALKLEWNRTNERGLPSSGALRLQYALAF